MSAIFKHTLHLVGGALCVATLLASTDAAESGDFAVCHSPSPGAAGAHPVHFQTALQPDQSGRHTMLGWRCLRSSMVDEKTRQHGAVLTQ